MTFSILWFLADFLGPKLKILSQMLAIMSLASHVHLAGVPDGQEHSTTGAVARHESPSGCTSRSRVRGGAGRGFFLLPLPVSRVREVGLVEIDPAAIDVVMLPEPASLTALKVRSGERVEKGNPLAEFVSRRARSGARKARSRSGTSSRPGTPTPSQGVAEVDPKARERTEMEANGSRRQARDFAAQVEDIE